MLTYKMLSKRIRLLRWLAPLSVFLLVALYQAGPARWLHITLGIDYHLLAEMVLFGTLGPLLAFLVLDILARWMEERETSDLQAQALAEARENARQTRMLSDDALQAIFAAGVQLASLRRHLPDLTPDADHTLEEANQALRRAIHPLRSHLENQSVKQNGSQKQQVETTVEASQLT